MVLAALGSASASFEEGPQPPRLPSLGEAEPPAVLLTSDRPQGWPLEAEEVAWGPVVRQDTYFLLLVEDLSFSSSPHGWGEEE